MVPRSMIAAVTIPTRSLIENHLQLIGEIHLQMSEQGEIAGRAFRRP